MFRHGSRGRAYLLRALILIALTAGALTARASVTAASEGAAAVAADCATAEAPYAAYASKVPVTAQDLRNAEHAVLYLVNVERARFGLGALCWNDQIGGAARAHAENWRGEDRTCPSSPNWFGCSHWDSRPGYAWPPDRVAKSGYGPCSNYCVGENTYHGWGVSGGTYYGTPQAAVSWWMNHDGGKNKHRDAILKADWIHAGAGAATYRDTSRYGAAYVLNFGKR
jgi:uncharacterized protein YkwD